MGIVHLNYAFKLNVETRYEALFNFDMNFTLLDYIYYILYSTFQTLKTLNPLLCIVLISFSRVLTSFKYTFGDIL